MRKIVMQMMTTLNGRLDDPMEWVHGVSDDQYREIDRLYATFDTVLVGRRTYEEMAAYWPNALAEGAGTETNRRMARRMNDYRKLVFSRTDSTRLPAWNNAELVVAGTDAELSAYLGQLKDQPGGDIHLSGGASLAQRVLGLGLVDELHLFMYPVVSPGASWFSELPGKYELKSLSSNAYENGVVKLHYAPASVESRARPSSFTEMLT